MKRRVLLTSVIAMSLLIPSVTQVLAEEPVETSIETSIESSVEEQAEDTEEESDTEEVQTEVTEVETPTEDEVTPSEEPEEPVAHEHTFEYWANTSGPGHWTMCSDYEGCGFCQLEDCVFENGVCIYCGAQQPEEEPEPVSDTDVLVGEVYVFDSATVYVEE